MVRIITRRSNQKRNRIQLYNLKQLINSNSSNQYSSNSNSTKVKKSRNQPKHNKQNKKSRLLIISTESSRSSKSIKSNDDIKQHTKITIITRSFKLNNFNFIIKKEHEQDNIYNVKQEQKKSNNIVNKIPIITRSQIKRNSEFINNYKQLSNI